MERKWDSSGASTSASVDDGDSSSGAEFEVFLSFRGPDTRLNFTDSLYHSLIDVGVRVFRDDEEIRQGEKIGDELLHAIESSKIYVPIFSRNYASSKWCLRELTHMVECLSKAKDKMILPIFYDVDPDDVELKTGLYVDALKKHEEKFGHDVPQWKEALTGVTRIKGLSLKGKGHGEIIKAIIGDVMGKLMKRRRNLPDHLIGINGHVEDIMSLLNEGSCDIRYLVIHGMGGIGKTTLAGAIFNRISNQFEGCSFLSDVHESTQRGRIINLQKQLLSEILQNRSPEIHDSNAGINIIRERFRGKKVLLVLDDVDEWDQLSKLAEKSDWFGRGSKIIITTRNINFLSIEKDDGESSRNQAHFEEFKFYEMKEMNFSDALKLFSQHALGMDSPPPHYEDISRKITSKAGRLPLALEVIGSSLFGENRSIWKCMLQKLDSMPNQKVFDKLKISYDMLNHAQKEIFLDIASFFIGKERLHPYYMWKALNYLPKIEVLVLARMSLIKIEENNSLWMHDQLRDLGREIIQREDIDVPGRRSRLWEPKIALNVVKQKEGTEKIVALRLTGLSEVRNFTSKEFSKLPNLRFLELYGGNLVGNFKNLLSKLTWLSWSNCPSKLKAKNLSLEKLAVLELSDNDDEEDWTGWGQCLVSKNLKVIHIAYCPSLKRTPDFSKCKNLKRLVLLGCRHSLVVDGSLSKLEHLKHLEIKGINEMDLSDEDLSDEDHIFWFAVPSTLGCLRSLSTLKIQEMDVRELHHSIGEMTRLRYFSLRYGFLRTLPDSIGKLKSLVELDLDGTRITKLPHSIGDLKMLTKMSLHGTPVEKLPNSIGMLESLIELNLESTEITELPACIENLKRLEILVLSFSRIRELPKSIGMLENLKRLEASWCRNLEGDIPSEIGGLRSLKMLNLVGSKIRRLPTSMTQLSHLQQLRLSKCDQIEQLPELPTSLKELDFSPHLLRTSLNLSNLNNLIKLQVLCDYFESSKVIIRDAKIEWIEMLSNLEELELTVEEFTFAPINLASLSRLQSLKIALVDPRSLVGLPSSLEVLVLYNTKSPMESSLFYNLTNLSNLSLWNFWLREVEFDDVLGQHPEKLTRLTVGGNKFLERLSVSKLKGLRSLTVLGCPGLLEIQGGEKLESLEALDISECSSLKRLPHLSELKKLRKLDLRDCPLTILPGLQLQDTCEFFFFRCGILPDFIGNYKEWKDSHGHSGDDINGQL